MFRIIITTTKPVMRHPPDHKIALPLTPLFGEGGGGEGGEGGGGLAEEAVSFTFPLNPPLG